MHATSRHGGGEMMAARTEASGGGGGENRHHRRQKSTFVQNSSSCNGSKVTVQRSRTSSSINAVLGGGGGQHQQQRRHHQPGSWLSNGSVSAINNMQHGKALARNKSFAVVGSTGSNNNNNNNSAADKQRSRFAHVQPLVDTGKYSVTRHAAYMKEWLKDNGKRPNEKFHRIKASSLVQYILADAERHFPKLFNSPAVVETRMGAGDNNNNNYSGHQPTTIEHNDGTRDFYTVNGRIQQMPNTSSSRMAAFAGGDNMFNSVKGVMNQNNNQFRHSIVPHQAPKYVLIDVRLPHDFHRNRLRTAKNFPYTRTAIAHNPKDDVFRLYENHPETVLIVYDDDGIGPSTRVASFFAERNMNNIHLLTGGLTRVYELFPMLVCGKPPSVGAVPHGSKDVGTLKSRQQHKSTDDDMPSAAGSSIGRSHNNSLFSSSASVIGSGINKSHNNNNFLPSATTTAVVDNRYFNEDEIVDLLDCMARQSHPTVPPSNVSFSNKSCRGDKIPYLLSEGAALNSIGSGTRKPVVEKLVQRVRRQLALKKEQYKNKSQQGLPPPPPALLDSTKSVTSQGAPASVDTARTLVASVSVKSAAPISSMRAAAERHRRRKPWKP